MNGEEKERWIKADEDRQELDWQIWGKLADWARRRVAQVLRLAEGDVVTLTDSTEGREADLLYVEIHQYFCFDAREDGEPEAGIIGGSLAELCINLKLEDFEIFCLIFTMLAELDSRFERLFIYLNNNWSEPYLNVEWAIRLFLESMDADPRYLKYFFPDGRLCQYLFELVGESGSGLRRGLRLRAAVVRYLLTSGRQTGNKWITWYSDSTLQEDCIYEAVKHADDEITRELQMLLWRQKKLRYPVCVQIKGRGFMQKLSYAIWYAEQRQQKLGLIRYQVVAEGLEPECYGSLFQEIVVYNGIPCIYGWENTMEEETGRKHWRTFLIKAAAFFPVLFLLSGEDAPEPSLPEPGRMIRLVVPMPDKTEQLGYWKLMALHYQRDGYSVRNHKTDSSSIEEAVLEQAAGQYTFLPEELEEIFERAVRMTGCHDQYGSVITEDILFRSCRQQVKHRLSEWAVRVETDFHWEDLVLGEEQRDMLKEAVSQVRYRQKVYDTWGFSRKHPYGNGLSILLTGPPGTGKTMAAQVLAGTLGMELYRLQLPALVSKYIGETEKNLRTIFQEGEKSQAVLFFDEADVLFSKRTEVKDSHDKYSNMEAAYMLQRLEEYSGVVILATNFPQNIDQAFKRRLTFTIEFYMPDSTQRYQLWKKSFPEELPLGGDVDIQWLAERFELTGSNIKNIAVNAAFLAAPETELVCMCHIMQALQNEYRKSGTVPPVCNWTDRDEKAKLC